MSAPAEERAAPASVALETVIRRDRAVAIAALATITAVAWAYILWLAYGGMAGMPMDSPAPANAPMDMPGMNMAGDMAGMNMGAAPATNILAPAIQPWSGAQFAAMFVMWTVMMIGMMTPSAAPMILLYARVGRAAHAQGKPFAAVAWFAAGYFAAWAAFSFVATGAQWALEQAALLSPAMAARSRLLGGAVLLAAGLYEITPLKRACLAHCQAPLVFLQTHGGFRAGAKGAFAFGARHGLYCIGCCWALMALLFVGGVMNVLWIAGLAILVLAEKALAFGMMASRVIGFALIGAGVWMIVT